MVTIMGEGLLPPDGLTTSSSDIVVTIDGSVCQWFKGGLVPTNLSILCRTSAHPGAGERQGSDCLQQRTGAVQVLRSLVQQFYVGRGQPPEGGGIRVHTGRADCRTGYEHTYKVITALCMNGDCSVPTWKVKGKGALSQTPRYPYMEPRYVLFVCTTHYSP